MKWFWYVAKKDELMIDLDGRALLEIALKRLERTPELRARSVFIIPSQNSEHYHLAIRLSRPMPLLDRMVWQLFLMDHVYRSVRNLFRVIDKIPASSLLISPYDWKELSEANPTSYSMPGEPFWRAPDATCSCEGHKDPEKIKSCPAHIKLRGRL